MSCWTPEQINSHLFLIFYISNVVVCHLAVAITVDLLLVSVTIDIFIISGYQMSQVVSFVSQLNQYQLFVMQTIALSAIQYFLH